MSFFCTPLYMLCEHFNKGFQKQKYIFFQTESSLWGIWSRNIALNNNILNFLGIFFGFMLQKVVRTTAVWKLHTYLYKKTFAAMVLASRWKLTFEITSGRIEKQRSKIVLHNFSALYVLSFLRDVGYSVWFPDMYLKWLNSLPFINLEDSTVFDAILYFLIIKMLKGLKPSVFSERDRPIPKH